MLPDAGRISWVRSDAGERRFDLARLERVYSPLPVPGDDIERATGAESLRNAVETTAQSTELDARITRSQFAAMKGTIIWVPPLLFKVPSAAPPVVPSPALPPALRPAHGEQAAGTEREVTPSYRPLPQAGTPVDLPAPMSEQLGSRRLTTLRTGAGLTRPFIERCLFKKKIKK
jgi:hypothetical protein